MNPIKYLITIFLLVLNTSCITDIVIDTHPVTKNAPSHLNPVNLSAGIYFSPEFKNYKHIRRFSDFRYIAPVGSSSYDMLKTTFSHLFTKATEIDEATFHGLKKHNFDVLIEPNIESYHFMLGFDKRSIHHSILYRFNISSADHTPTRIWRVHGLADLPLKPFQVVWSHTKNDLDNARSTIYQQTAEVFSQFSKTGSAKPYTKFSIKPDNFSIDITAQQSYQLVTESDTIFSTSNNDIETLNQQGIIVIHASIHNKSNKALVFQGYNTRLVFDASRQIALSDASLVAIRTSYPRLRFRQPNNLDDIFPSLISQKKQTLSANSSFNTYVERLRSLQPRKIILPAQSHYKAVFYFMPVAGTKAHNLAKLKLWFYDYENLTSTPVLTDIRDFSFSGTPVIHQPENINSDEVFF